MRAKRSICGFEPSVFPGVGVRPLSPVVRQRAGDSTHCLSTATQRLDDLAEERLIRIAAAQQPPHLARVAQDPRADLQELEPEGAHLRPRQFRARQRQRAQPFQQHIRATGEQQPKLIGPPALTTGPVRKQAQLLLLDPVLHLAPRAQ